MILDRNILKSGWCMIRTVVFSAALSVFRRISTSRAHFLRSLDSKARTEAPGAASMVRSTYSYDDALSTKKLQPPLTGLKQQFREGFRARSHHVPSLPLERAANDPQRQRLPTTTLSTTTINKATLPATTTAKKNPATLKGEALYLAAILHARLSDSAHNRDGRGLLSRAVAREELDQFLLAFFSDPTNVQFAREKVRESSESLSYVPNQWAVGRRQCALASACYCQYQVFWNIRSSPDTRCSMLVFVGLLGGVNSAFLSDGYGCSTSITHTWYVATRCRLEDTVG